MLALTVEGLVDAGPELHLVELTIFAQFLATITRAASGEFNQR